MEIIKLPIDALTVYKKNAKRHTDEQVKHIVNSIKRFGHCDPIGVWGSKNTIVEGVGRYLAHKQLGTEEVECIRLDHLSDEERRAYTLAHNQTTLETSFDFGLLDEELSELLDFDMADFGFTTNQFDFAPISEDDVPRLDKKKVIICTECGAEIKL